MVRMFLMVVWYFIVLTYLFFPVLYLVILVSLTLSSTVPILVESQAWALHLKPTMYVGCQGMYKTKTGTQQCIWKIVLLLVIGKITCWIFLNCCRLVSESQHKIKKKKLFPYVWGKMCILLFWLYSSCPLKEKKKKAYQNIEVFRIINLLGFVLQRDMKIYDILCGFCRATMWNIAALYVWTLALCMQREAWAEIYKCFGCWLWEGMMGALWIWAGAAWLICTVAILWR